MDMRKFSSASQRRKSLEEKLKISLPHIGTFSLDEKTVSVKNCENMIGVAQIPLGIAGPLKMTGNHSAGDFYIPLATTEGALVASVNRGCKVISLANGAQVAVHKVGVTRGPVFYTGSIKKSMELYEWVKNNKENMAHTAEKTSNHLKFKKVDVRTQGSYAFMRFYFDSQEAMGMNMATIATDKIAELIEKEVGVKCVSIAGNFDIDKKPAWLNFINNRGLKAWAEVIIPKQTVKDELKTTPDEIFEVWLAKCMLGSAMSGSLGFNAHYANIVAAFFAATGQDIAHTVEGSMGITTAKVLKNGDLYFSVYLPAIMLGTVGGGTNLATQKEATEIIGVKTSDELAEVLGGAVLAGELSLLASLAEKSLVKAHQKLGRGELI
ncbi:MAG: hydroxymethylglutaryl-CoA reductase [Patescibacteria group bacterium]|nr:hydroxymethylglutaryl-CoA reductase [Patescibacteria group bacterium]